MVLVSIEAPALNMEIHLVLGDPQVHVVFWAPIISRLILGTFPSCLSKYIMACRVSYTYLETEMISHPCRLFFGGVGRLFYVVLQSLYDLRPMNLLFR